MLPAPAMKHYHRSVSVLALLAPFAAGCGGADVSTPPVTAQAQIDVNAQVPPPPQVDATAAADTTGAADASGDAYDDNDPAALNDFHPALDSHGQWVDDPTYGTVWVPAAAEVGPDFTPYQTAGHWAYDGNDYVWVSDYDWGWAPFHYGRWVYADRGWAWIPGREYRGAWVNWGADDGYGYVGWYPMGPTFLWRGGVAVSYVVQRRPALDLRRTWGRLLGERGRARRSRRRGRRDRRTRPRGGLRRGRRACGRSPAGEARLLGQPGSARLRSGGGVSLEGAAVQPSVHGGGPGGASGDASRDGHPRRGDAGARGDHRHLGVDGRRRCSGDPAHDDAVERLERAPGRSRILSTRPGRSRRSRPPRSSRPNSRPSRRSRFPSKSRSITARAAARERAAASTSRRPPARIYGRSVTGGANVSNAVGVQP